MTEMNNTPNPLVPQGSLQEQSKRKSQVRIIVFSILAIHLVLLGALLIQGCRPEAPKSDLPPPPPTNVTDNLLPPPPTNVVIPPPPTNVVVPPAPTNVVDIPPAVPTEYVIQKGDTFGSLAKKYGVSIKAIQQANPGVDSTRLKIGQKINIPQKPPGGASPTSSTSGTVDPGTASAEPLYTVQKSDTLTKIAKDHGVTIKALRAANSLKTDQIKPGQKLKIPAKTAVASTPAAPAAPAPAAPAPMTPAPAAVTTTSAPALPASPSSP
jgi:membrane-bound lytic murein transglycosylase D